MRKKFEVVGGVKGLSPNTYESFWQYFGPMDKGFIEARVLDFDWKRSADEHPQTTILTQMAVAMVQGIGEESDEYDDLDGCGSYIELLARDFPDPEKFKGTAARVIKNFEEHYARAGKPHAHVLNAYAESAGIEAGPRSQQYEPEELAILPYNPQDALNHFMSYEMYFDFLQNVRVTLDLSSTSVEFPQIDRAFRVRIAPKPSGRGDGVPGLG